MPPDSAPDSALTLRLPDSAATAALAGRLARLLRAGDAVLLEGPLGAGKSVLAREILRALTSDPMLEVPSPTFTLVQGYGLPSGVRVAHFDLYRLTAAAEMVELGWEEARDGMVLVEWPDRLAGERPTGPAVLTVTLAFGPTPGERAAMIEGWPGRPVADACRDLTP